jgi:hypothetical protein
MLGLWLSGYGLDDRRKDISSTLSDQTGSEAHPASCTMGTGGSFPGCKARSGDDADHSLLSNVEV